MAERGIIEIAWEWKSDYFAIGCHPGKESLDLPYACRQMIVKKLRDRLITENRKRQSERQEGGAG